MTNVTMLHGLGVGRGAVIAPLAFLSGDPVLPLDEPAPPDGSGIARIREALDEVARQMADASAAASDPTLAAVLASTSAMAADPALAAEAARHVTDGTGPATAVDRAVESFVDTFTAAGGYLAERVTDLRSVRHRAVARLLGLPAPGLPQLSAPSVIAARDLSPADTANLDLNHVVAIVTELGGPTGHTAIIARQLGLPCVVRAAGVTALNPGTLVMVDAAAGVITVEPDQAQQADVERRAAAARALADDTRPGATADGHPVQLLANIGTPDDALRAAATGVEGAGLFRTEVLFLDRPEAPTVSEQTTQYLAAVTALAGSKVVVRTLDAGADKPLPFITSAPEENPALGVRGYRLTRGAPSLLKTQLEALGAVVRTLPAVQRGDVWVMAPMIATAGEAREFALAARAAGVHRVGVMVEVPSAALRAADILAEVDFVSIGTNDLAQYAMATDRLRGELTDLIDPWQPAVLDLIATTAAAGAAAGKPVGVCGECAADPLMALVLVGLGVTSLSMAPAAVPAVRFALRNHSIGQCRDIAAQARQTTSSLRARQTALSLTNPDVRELLEL